MRLLPVLAFALTARLVAQIPSAGLIGHWEIQATQAVDRSPARNALTFLRFASQRENGSGFSLKCDGFEVGAVVEERTPLVFPKGCTLALWVSPTRERGQEPLLGRPNPTPGWTTPLVGLYLSDSRPVFGLFGPKKVVLEGPPIPARAWSFVAATADGETVTLWVDGRKVAETPQPAPIPGPAGQSWYLGRSATQFFRGLLGPSFVWNRALTAQEIAGVHQATAAAFPPTATTASGPAASWGDRYVSVASPGSRADGGPWRDRPTRTLAGLNGFTPAAPTPVDRWGGRADRPARKATGYFRTEQVDGRWWLITPEGHLFWNTGINAVRAPRGTPPTGAAAYAERATEELRSLGFNDLGNWSLPQMQTVKQPLPWSIRLNFMSTFAQHHQQTYATSGHTGFTEQCFPVFHPDFPAWARQQAQALKATLDDATVIGIFTDNELQCPSDLLDRHLRLPESDPYLDHGRRAALAWLAAEGRPADPARLTLKDRYRFIAHVFSTYARIVHEAIRAVDSHHLILGPRFNVHRGQFDNPWFWPAVGPWIDVVAVNYYVLWGPQPDEIREWSEAMKRPVILTEWYSKAQDAPNLSNAKGAGWLVRTQADRARFYQHFTLAAFETPSLVGFHYFKYMDDDADSVALDSAGGANKGIYRPDGSAWTELQEAAREVNRQAYPLIDFFDRRHR